MAEAKELLSIILPVEENIRDQTGALRIVLHGEEESGLEPVRMLGFSD